MNHRFDLGTGVLQVCTHREVVPLAWILEFAGRNNPKRGYLFVSRVLGKHIPCRPSMMLQIHQHLAKQLSHYPKVVFVGMAETAVGLGGGVADSYARHHQIQTGYLHSTRYPLSQPLLFNFVESHSHATEHLLYEPSSAIKPYFDAAETAVLVDDEISTGQTLLKLAVQYKSRYPQIKNIVFCSLVNWLPNSRRQQCAAQLEKIGVQLDFASLIDGEFFFEPNSNAKTLAQPNVQQNTKSYAGASKHTGRTGIPMPFAIEQANFQSSGPVDHQTPLTVIGTGEFMFQPFMYALALEKQGFDVLFQSTTRSPIKTGLAIQQTMEFDDDRGERFIYNCPKNSESTAIVCFEHAAHAKQNRLLVDNRLTAIYQGNTCEQRLVS